MSSTSQCKNVTLRHRLARCGVGPTRTLSLLNLTSWRSRATCTLGTVSAVSSVTLWCRISAASRKMAINRWVFRVDRFLHSSETKLAKCLVFALFSLLRTPATLKELELILSPPIPLRLYTLPYWSNRPFLIFDIWAVWRSVLSARAPKCQKLKTVG